MNAFHKFVLWLVTRIYPYKAYGMENIPEGAAVIPYNHFSVMDPLFIRHAYKGTICFPAKIELFKNILRTYVMAGTSAYAAENINKQQYQNNRLSDNVEAICSKLGVEYSARNKATKSNNSGFFSNNKSQGTPKEFQNSTLDDINNLMN